MTDLRRSNLPPAELMETPYVGLVPYQEEDADFFFGRDREIRIVTSNLRAHRLTILYGPSGAGKTSLLRAGVVHELRREVLTRASAQPDQVPFAICTIAAWRDDPLLTLMNATQDAACEALGRSADARWQPGKSVVRSLRAWTRRVRTLLIVLDQFEDYFLYHPDEFGEGTFAGELPAIVNEPNLRVNFLLSVREDAWAKLDRFKGSIPRVFANYVRVDHLSRKGAEDAIRRPIEEWNRRLPHDEQPYSVDEALVETVIEAAADGGLALAHAGAHADGGARAGEHVEAPFLQLVMERLWRATVEAGSHDVAVARLEQLGGAQRIVENHLLEALGTLAPKEQAIAADAFFFLVTRSRTKIAHSASDLAEWTKRPEPEVSAVLDKLCRGDSGRILRVVSSLAEGAEATRYELFHDLLAEPILEWRLGFEHERERRAAIRKFARIGGVLLSLAMVFGVLGVWALVQRSEAKQATRSATSLALASAAKEQLEGHLPVSLLLGLEAYRASPSPEAASAMTEALEAARESGAESILRGDQGGVRAIALSPDGRTLASADFAGTIRLWDIQARVPLGEPLQAHTDEIWSVAFSPDGQTLASASLDGTVRLWNVRDGQAIGDPLSSDVGRVRSVAFSPDGRTLAVGGSDRTVQLWDVAARRTIGLPLRGHHGDVVSLAFSRDGRTLASAGYDGTVLLWDMRSRRPRKRLSHDGVLSVAFARDGHTLASAGAAGTVRLWDSQSGRPLGAPLRSPSGDIWSVAWSPDGRTLAVSGSDDTVRLWDVRARRPVGEPLRGHTDRVVAVAFDPDGHVLASAGYDGTVRLWSMPETAVLGQPLRGGSGPIKSVAFSSNGTTLASVGEDGAIERWRVQGHRPLAQPRSLGQPGEFFSVASSPDGRTLASGGDDGTVRLWDGAKGAPAQLLGHTGPVEDVAFSGDGRTLASAGDDGTIRLWDVSDRTSLGEPLRGHTGTVWSVALSPDGRTVASGGRDGTVRLWDARTARARGKLPIPGDDVVQSVAFSPDGRTLATGDIDGFVRLWDARSLASLGEPLIHKKSENVVGLAFSPDGRTLASSGEDGAIRLWDIHDRRSLGAPLLGHEGAVRTIAFSADGHTLATGGDDGTVQLWEGILWDGLADLRARVCRLVVGNLTRSEWSQLAPGLAYRATCPQQP
jgi:WD40 repeat protein